MSEKVQNPVEEQEVAAVVATGNADVQQVVKSLIAMGGKRHNGVKVTNVNHKDMGSHIRISLTVDKQLDAYLADEDGVFTKQTSNIVFSSNYALSGLAKTIDDIAMFGNAIADPEKVTALGFLLNQAKIDIVQVEYDANVDIHNPFSSGDSVRSYDHTTIINYIVGIELGAPGQKIVERALDKAAEMLF